MMQKEPAITVATVTAFVTAVIGLLVAFGLDISTEQRDAILGVIGPAFVVILALGPIVRQFVFSPATVEKIAADQYAAGVPPTDDVPNVPPPASREDIVTDAINQLSRASRSGGTRGPA